MNAKFSWLFQSTVPLPAEHSIAAMLNACEDLGNARLSEAGGILGAAAAAAAASKLGRYELSDEVARALGLAGAELGEGGEFPALSPGRWAAHSGAECPRALTMRLEDEGREIAGLLLSDGQRDSFLRFLARNRVNTGGAITAGKAVSLARHFFSAEPVQVVVRYTAGRA